MLNSAISGWERGRGRPRYRELILQLADELALDPAKVDQLLRAADFPFEYGAPSALNSRHQLRAPTADFVGRGRETAEILHTVMAALTAGGGAVISGVQGMGGIGKTELAYYVANRLRETFPHAQIVLNLCGSSGASLTPIQALQMAIHAFAPDTKLPEDREALQRHYRSTLHNQRVLILADDAHDAAQVAPLIPPAGSALLVTSRKRFSLPGMATIDLEQLSETDAIALLRGICARLKLTEAQSIARACGYLPLALRISGSIIRNDRALPISTYIDQLVDERQRLAHLSDPDDPQFDVAASLALSYGQLDAASQRVFRQLGVFIAEFFTPMALAVIEASEGADVETTLRLLLRRNLVIFNADHSRWRLHDLVRDLARSYLKAAGEHEAAMGRYAQAAVQIAQETQEQYRAGGADILVALARFDAERAHIDAAQQWALAHMGTPSGDALLLACTRATKNIGQVRYDRREYVPQLEEALAAARRLGERHGEEEILNTLGLTYWGLGDARRASTYFEQELTIAREIGDQRGEGDALNNLGIAAWALGDMRRAIMYYEQRLALAREIGDRRGKGLALGNLGVAYGMLGDAQSASRYFEQGLTIAQEIGDRRGEALVLSNLGYISIESGDMQCAIMYSEQALTIYRELGNQQGEVIVLGNVGLTHLNLGGNVQRAVAYFEEALTLSREVGCRREEGQILEYLGRAYATFNDISRATIAFTQALAIFGEIGDRSGEAECRWYFGLTLARHGEATQALPLLRATIAYEQEIEHTKVADHAALLVQIETRADRLAELEDAARQGAIGQGEEDRIKSSGDAH